MDDMQEEDEHILKISIETMDMCTKFLEDGAPPMAIAGVLMATASRMYQDALSPHEWEMLLDSDKETTTWGKHKGTMH